MEREGFVYFNSAASACCLAVFAHRLEFLHERIHVIIHGVEYRNPESYLTHYSTQLRKLVVRRTMHL